MTGKQAFELVKQHHPTLGGADIISSLNQGIAEFCRRSEINKASYSQTTTAGTRYYTLDDKIYKILSVKVDEIEIPRLVGPILIDDEEFSGDANNDRNLGAPSTISNERYWYQDLDRIAIVEKTDNAISRDDKKSHYQSISETGLILRIKAIAGLTDLSISTIQSASSALLGSAPGDFHRHVAEYAIAQGYRSAAGMDIEKAEYFNALFEKGVKEAKKMARSSYVSSGMIKPVDF